MLKIDPLIIRSPNFQGLKKKFKIKLKKFQRDYKMKPVKKVYFILKTISGG